MAERLTVSIIGVTGYTGLELLRMLLAHPKVDIAYLTSRQHEDTAIGDLYPHLAHLNLRVTDTDHKDVAKDSDVVFLALPHKTAQDVVAEMHGHCKVIDLSADYRLDDLETYEKYYHVPHNHPGLLGQVVYGLPEINREDIRKAVTVANPGCFALLSQLMLLPFAGAIDHADIMAVTGSSGSGKSPSEGTHHPVRSHNFKSYNINAHRHIPEIIRTAQISEAQLNFVPSSGPFVRGIFATAFVRTKDGAHVRCAGDVYDGHPYVRVMEDVALANVVGSNFCDLSFRKISEGNYIVQGVIDNLVKGAAGCAVQNMNLMCGFEETEGLAHLGTVYP
ncbi:MAG: N-acetyl-gamma-glutamyl-phosphate reductase [Alphaproteobacteria bacterium]|nr:N-acetyl-gamma-glutamyl-phosphate reductase [Alphaproteobacteria bacterium]